MPRTGKEWNSKSSFLPLILKEKQRDSNKVDLKIPKWRLHTISMKFTQMVLNQHVTSVQSDSFPKRTIKYITVHCLKKKRSTRPISVGMVNEVEFIAVRIRLQSVHQWRILYCPLNINNILPRAHSMAEYMPIANT